MDSLEDRLEQALDNSLRMTFPASDPIAVSATGRTSTGEARESDRETHAEAHAAPRKEVKPRRAPRR